MNGKAEEIERLIEKYDAGATSSAEEQMLFAYFSTDAVSAELQKEQSYFCCLNELKMKQKRLSLSNENKQYAAKKRYSLASFAKYSAVAASVTLVAVAGLYFQMKPKDFALIDGKKYTDKETMEQVFTASIQNVKENTQDIFADLDDVSQW